MSGVVDNKSGVEYTGFDEIELNNQRVYGLSKNNNNNNSSAATTYNDKKLKTH